jgi:hypothetical protein
MAIACGGMSIPKCRPAPSPQPAVVPIAPIPPAATTTGASVAPELHATEGGVGTLTGVME